MTLFTFRTPTLDDAEMILDWRTRPEITRFMFTDIEPDLDRQRAWLTRCAGRDDFVHFIIQHEAKPIGYLAYAEIDRLHRHCSPGTYLVLEPKQRFLAAFIQSFILDYAFYRLGMHKVLHYIMAGNEAFLGARDVMGARAVGVLRQQVFKYGQFHDVHVFEILESEWRERHHLFSQDKTLPAFPADGS